MKNIVVLGAGFGGLRTALLLDKKLAKLNKSGQYRLVLVDKNSYHTYTPTLYEIATTSKETADYLDLKRVVTFGARKIIKNTSIFFIERAVRQLDLVKGIVYFEGGEQTDYEYLVVALGAETNDYGIPGVKTYGLELKSFEDALKIRDTIVNKIEDRKLEPEAGGRFESAGLKIVIGGAGSTGVELAGELNSWLCEMKDRERICEAQVTIIDGAPHILNSFPKKIRDLALRRLRRLGTWVVNEEMIKEVTEENIILKSGQAMPYDVFIWTGGIKSPELISGLPFVKDKPGKIQVTDYLECTLATPDLNLYGKVYAIGDCVCFNNPKTDNPVPSVARAAMAEGRVVAHNIIEDIKLAEKKIKKAKHLCYKPREYPYIIPVGGKWAIAKVGPIVFSGLAAWIFKGLVELFYLTSIMPVFRALKIWLTGLKIFVQNDRLG